MASGNVGTNAGPVLSSFSANLRQHLTELTLKLGSARHRKEDHLGLLGDLGVLNMLTALQKLEAGDLDLCIWVRPLCHDLLEQKVALKLPNLVSLRMSALGHGILVLSCPKLAKLQFIAMRSLRIEVKEAALDDVMLKRCNHFAMVFSSPKDQLQELLSLHVSQSSETGRPLIEDLSHMRRLRTLVYTAFPTECMPTSFPLGLESLTLCPLDWYGDIPEGVDKMGYVFEDYPEWYFTELKDELLSLESLKTLHLGEFQYRRSKDGSRWRFY